MPALHVRIARTSLLAVVLAATVVSPRAAIAAVSSICGPVSVPGAAYQEQVRLPELTTAGTVASGHTDPADWAGLTPAGLPTPSGVPGIQIDGYFPDSSTTNTSHGWNHDSQFVIRLPDRWNGGVVVAGTPGNREQYANDRSIADWVLARGYAFAATDKGNTGPGFFRDGKHPGDAIAEWNARLTQLTLAVKLVVLHRYCRPPSRTIATGMSNGGYLVRWQLENHPELYDGGVDWEGPLWTADGSNLLTVLPTALRAYPEGEQGHAAMVAAGFPAGSEFLWPFHYKYYWDLTQRIYREELDPGFDGAIEAGTPYCKSGTPACDADYDYAGRPADVHQAVARISLTGRIGKPLLTLHGTFDVLLPITSDSDVYARMVHAAGRDRLFRYYRIEGGNHVDALFDTFPTQLRPITPCHRAAFRALEDWLNWGVSPPRSTTVSRPSTADPADLIASCHLR